MAGGNQNGSFGESTGKISFFESLVCVTAQHREMLDQELHTF
jgi:UDP-N-acetylglucosamine 2-epimerase